ncbi:MAG: hypothetical protein JJ934_19545 [Pseudomonadales bacterium]|nr:hypothetical protein [Pseudomonadales bacterium]
MKQGKILIFLLACLSISSASVAQKCSPGETIQPNYVAPNQYHLIFNNQTNGELGLEGPIPPEEDRPRTFPSFPRNSKIQSGEIRPRYPLPAYERGQMLKWNDGLNQLVYEVTRDGYGHQILIENFDLLNCLDKPKFQHENPNTKWNLLTPERQLRDKQNVGSCVYVRSDLEPPTAQQELIFRVKTSCLDDGLPQLLIVFDPSS